MDTAQRETFGAVLKRHRLAAGLSQEQLAERAGMTAQAVGALERGFRRSPYRDTVRALARALDLDPAGAEALEAAVARGRTEAAGSPGTAPSTLPVPPSPLIGRRREVAEVRGLIDPSAASRTRILTLVGLGGVGKTRLALEVAHAAGDLYPDGVVFVALAPLRDPDLVLPTIARALRITEGGDRSLAEALRAHLSEKRMLLLLDNVEQVAAAAPAVAELLAWCPALRVLATSRGRLHLNGERVYPISPLPTPDQAQLPELAELGAVPAVALLVQRAQAAAPGFALDRANAVAIAALCAHLEGLPLALELAAPRLAALSPDMLLRRLTPRLALLTGGAKDLPDRQRTLRATLDWSHALLSPTEQAAFRWLSVFAGGCTLEAAEAMPAASGPHVGGVSDVEHDVAGLLEALIDRSLVRREWTEDGEPRFGLLETVREYGLEALEAAGEREQARRAHAVYFIALAERGAPAMLGPEQVTWSALLEREHDNLRAALAWAGESGEATLGLRLAGALWRFWSARGHLSEGRRWLREALADTDGSPDALPEPSIEARALCGAAHLAIEQGAYDEAGELCTRVLALTREHGPRHDLLVALNVQALLDRERGRYTDSLASYEEALAVARTDRVREGVAAALAGMGAVAARTDDAPRARMLLEQGMALYRILGDTRGLARVLADLTLDAVSTGAHVHAESLGVEALALFRELGDTGPISEALFALGTAVQNQGEYERAEALYEESLSVHRHRGDALGATRPISALGLLWLRRGDVMRARALLTDALATVRRFDHSWARAVTLTLLGHAELAAGAVEHAWKLFGESAAIFRIIGSPLFLSWLLEGLAGVAAADGHPRLAARLCGAGDALRERLGSALPPVHPAGHARTVATAIAALGVEAFASAQAEGRAIAAEEAIAAALAPDNQDSARRKRAVPG